MPCLWLTKMLQTALCYMLHHVPCAFNVVLCVKFLFFRFFFFLFFFIYSLCSNFLSFPFSILWIYLLSRTDNSDVFGFKKCLRSWFSQGFCFFFFFISLYRICVTVAQYTLSTRVGTHKLKFKSGPSRSEFCLRLGYNGFQTHRIFWMIFFFF